MPQRESITCSVRVTCDTASQVCVWPVGCICIYARCEISRRAQICVLVVLGANGVYMAADESFARARETHPKWIVIMYEV